MRPKTPVSFSNEEIHTQLCRFIRSLSLNAILRLANFHRVKIFILIALVCMPHAYNTSASNVGWKLIGTPM